MIYETETLKRIANDGVFPRRETLALILSEAAAEIETLRAKVKDMGYELEAADARFVK